MYIEFIHHHSILAKASQGRYLGRYSVSYQLLTEAKSGKPSSIARIQSHLLLDDGTRRAGVNCMMVLDFQELLLLYR